MEYSSRVFAFDNIFKARQLHLDIGDVLQISEVSLMRGGEIFEHSQICDEITYVVSGRAKIFCDDECLILNPGEIHFIKNGMRHRLVAEAEENFRFICIGFVGNEKNMTVSRFMESLAGRSFCVAPDNGIVQSLCEFVIQELYNWDSQSCVMLNHYLSQILITVSRILCGKTFLLQSRSEKKTSYEVMYHTLRYIDNEYLMITSVEEVSDALSYSKYYLSHLFRDKMGITMKEYINQKKISYAIKLLEQKVLTVEQISEYLNFSSVRAFRRVFKQLTGVSPTEYRKSRNSNFCP